MNDWSATHYCSGGESGWTMYLDESYTSEHHLHKAGGSVDENYRQKEEKSRMEEKEEEEEEDLSMVSDASSGPPHYLEDNEEWLYFNNSYSFESARKCKEEKKKKTKSHDRNHHHHHQHSYLDDTASSPVNGCSKSSKISEEPSEEVLKENTVDFSQGFSATHYKRRSSLRKHFSFYGSKSKPEE